MLTALSSSRRGQGVVSCWGKNPWLVCPKYQHLGVELTNEVILTAPIRWKRTYGILIRIHYAITFSLKMWICFKAIYILGHNLSIMWISCLLRHTILSTRSRGECRKMQPAVQSHIRRHQLYTAHIHWPLCLLGSMSHLHVQSVIFFI